MPLVDGFVGETAGWKDDIGAQNSPVETNKAKKSKFSLKMPSSFRRGKLSEVSRRVVGDTEAESFHRDTQRKLCRSRNIPKRVRSVFGLSL